MNRLDQHGGTARLQGAHDGIGDLRRHGFLGLQAAGEDFDDARQLRNANDPLRRQIGNMDAADEGRDMVLAMRVELDVAQHDQIVVTADIHEGARQRFRRIVVIARKILPKGLGDAFWRVEQSLAAGVIAGPGEQYAHGGLGFFLRWALHHPGGRFARDFLDDCVH